MALLGTYIDSRTLAALAADGTVTFAHGLGSDPDFVIIQQVSTLSSTVSAYNLNAVSDATNITIQNGGEGVSPVYRAVSVVAHSIIR